VEGLCCAAGWCSAGEVSRESLIGSCIVESFLPGSLASKAKSFSISHDCSEGIEKHRKGSQQNSHMLSLPHCGYTPTWAGRCAWLDSA